VGLGLGLDLDVSVGVGVCVPVNGANRVVSHTRCRTSNNSCGPSNLYEIFRDSIAKQESSKNEKSNIRHFTSALQASQVRGVETALCVAGSIACGGSCSSQVRGIEKLRSEALQDPQDGSRSPSQRCLAHRLAPFPALGHTLTKYSRHHFVSMIGHSG
jgi:hypothetical protein